MGNDNTKLNFDPIPVTGAPRPELPKVPDLPSKLAATKPAETPAAAEPPTTPAPTPAMTSWLPDSVWQALQPSRTKGVLAAGVISLLGGAATMRYVWPPKPTATAQIEPERLVPPLPETTNGTAGGAFTTPPKVEPVSPPVLTTPIAGVPPVPSVELPALAVPAVTFSPPPPISPPPVIASLPPITLSPLPPVATSPRPVSELKIDLPTILPATGTVPMSPPPVPAATSPVAVSPLPVPGLPDLTSTAPPAPAALSVPAITGAAPVTTSPPPLPEVKLPPVTGATSPPVATAVSPPAALQLPPVTTPTTEVKLELPKLDTPPVSPIPVPGAKPAEVGVPKLPDIGLPNPAKVELPSPVAEVKPATTPALELPVVGAPALAAPPAAATAAKTDYDVDLHYVKGGDSWAAVSKQHYGDERYAEALKGYNQNATLTQLQRAEVPPIHVLRKNYATLIGKPVEKANEWGAITTATATEPKRSVTGGGYKTYVIPAGGRTIKEVAADAYGDEGRWGVVWESNPKLVPDKTIPEGTKIFLTSQAKIGE